MAFNNINLKAMNVVSEVGHNGVLQDRPLFERCHHILESAVETKFRNKLDERSFGLGQITSLYRNRYFSPDSSQDTMPLFEMYDRQWIDLSKSDLFSIIDNPESSEFRRASSFNRLIFFVEREVYKRINVSCLSNQELTEGSQLVSYLGKLTLWNSGQHNPQHHIGLNWILSKILSYTCGFDYKPYRNFLNHMIEYCALGISYQTELLRRFDMRIDEYRYRDSIEKKKYDIWKKEGKKTLGLLYLHKGRAYDLQMYLEKELYLKEHKIHPSMLTQQILDMIDTDNLRSSAYTCYEMAKQSYHTISKIVTVSMIELIKSLGHHPTGNQADDVKELAKLVGSILVLDSPDSSVRQVRDSGRNDISEQSSGLATTRNLLKQSGGSVCVKNVQLYALSLNLQLDIGDTDSETEIVQSEEERQDVLVLEIADIDDSTESMTESVEDQGRRPYGTGRAAEGNRPSFVDLRRNPNISSAVRERIRSFPSISMEQLSEVFPMLTPKQLTRQMKSKRFFEEVSDLLESGRSGASSAIVNSDSEQKNIGGMTSEKKRRRGT